MIFCCRSHLSLFLSAKSGGGFGTKLRDKQRLAFYCQNMLEMALILTEYDPLYEEVAFKFVQHFMWIAYAMDRIGENHDEMWDEEYRFSMICCGSPTVRQCV
jgi:hypothetical protein